MNAGKTTLIRALAAEIPPESGWSPSSRPSSSVWTRCPSRHPDLVALEARDANTEGEGAHRHGRASCVGPCG